MDVRLGGVRWWDGLALLLGRSVMGVRLGFGLVLGTRTRDVWLGGVC